MAERRILRFKLVGLFGRVDSKCFRLARFAEGLGILHLAGGRDLNSLLGNWFGPVIDFIASQ